MGSIIWAQSLEVGNISFCTRVSTEKNIGYFTWIFSSLLLCHQFIMFCESFQRVGLLECVCVPCGIWEKFPVVWGPRAGQQWVSKKYVCCLLCMWDICRLGKVVVVALLHFWINFQKNWKYFLMQLLLQVSAWHSIGAAEKCYPGKPWAELFNRFLFS